MEKSDSCNSNEPLSPELQMIQKDFNFINDSDITFKYDIFQPDDYPKLINVKRRFVYGVDDAIDRKNIKSVESKLLLSVFISAIDRNPSTVGIFDYIDNYSTDIAKEFLRILYEIDSCQSNKNTPRKNMKDAFYVARCNDLYCCKYLLLRYFGENVQMKDITPTKIRKLISTKLFLR